MVISAVNKGTLELTVIKLEGKKAHKKLSELKHQHGTVFGNPNGRLLMKPPISFGNSNMNMYGCCLKSCIGKGVVDILVRRLKLFSFIEACAILAHCHDRCLFEETIRKYGIVIIGLPDCAEEDLALAVHFFIEDLFGITPKIELCKKISEEYEPDKIGVIFDNIGTKEQICNKISILDGSDVEIEDYFDICWIVNEIYN